MRASDQTKAQNLAQDADKTGKRQTPTPLRAIRRKCLDCSGDSALEVKECVMDQCALWPFRFGRNPFNPKAQVHKPEKDLIAWSEKEPDAPKSAEVRAEEIQETAPLTPHFQDKATLKDDLAEQASAHTLAKTSEKAPLAETVSNPEESLKACASHENDHSALLVATSDKAPLAETVTHPADNVPQPAAPSPKQEIPRQNPEKKKRPAKKTSRPPMPLLDFC